MSDSARSRHGSVKLTALSQFRWWLREQVPGVLERYQRRITRLTGQVAAAVRELAGRAGSRLAAPGIGISRQTALRVLPRIALPGLEVPRVLGDDFALRKGLVYATILIDAETGRRVDVIEGRTADVAGDWLRAHPGAETVTRDGSGSYGEAVRSALPECAKASDRWHLRHGLAGAAAKEVAAHSACWAECAPLQEGTRAATTRERCQQVHDLRSKGVGLLDCSCNTRPRPWPGLSRLASRCSPGHSPCSGSRQLPKASTSARRRRRS